ncbi:glycosyltransferase [Pedobacter sp. JY14-1]|uniref:glycosyltransferase family 2 protein n=1 Tax=Pedobacter sp. JY14-1 TaxID=3034151 RepID=UPI0023E30533|nr:glycosyltransferase [Pedobacter sp. JY14-1]
MIKLGIVIPTFNRVAYLDRLLAQIQDFSIDHFDYHVVVVNDQSTDNTVDIVNARGKQFPNITLITTDGNWWWTKCFNEGMKVCFRTYDVDYVLSLNDDVELYEFFFQDLLEVISQLRFLNGEYFMFNCGSRDITNGLFSDLGTIKDFKNPFFERRLTLDDFKSNLSYAPVNHNHGRGMVLSKAVFELIGELDFKTFPQYLGDSEYANRAYRSKVNQYFTKKPYLLSYVDLTSRTKYENVYSLRNFLKRLSDKYSDCNLKTFYKYNKLTKTGIYSYYFTLIDAKKIVGGYVKRWIKAKFNNKTDLI